MLIWLANPIDTLWDNEDPIRPEDVDQYIHGMPMPPGYRAVTAALAGEPINTIAEHLASLS